METCTVTTPETTNASAAETRPSSVLTERSRPFLVPSATVLEASDAYLLQIEMPGTAKDAVELRTEENQLVVTGRRPSSDAPNLIHRERTDGDFQRTFRLHPAIDASRITARMEQGTLNVTLPKSETLRPRLIPLE